MLKNFQLVNTDGLGSVNYEGTEYPLDQINDTIAAKLYGKTHIIEKVADVAAEATALAEGDTTPAKTRKQS